MLYLGDETTHNQSLGGFDVTTTFSPLEYVLDMDGSDNRACMASAQPDKPVKVRVRHEQDASAQPLFATLSLDGEEYWLEVTTPDGQKDSFNCGNYKELLALIEAEKPD